MRYALCVMRYAFGVRRSAFGVRRSALTGLQDNKDQTADLFLSVKKS
jgi:hypothetical protein